MLIDSMLLTFCCSIIFLMLFPVIDLQSFLIQLYRVFKDVFVEFRLRDGDLMIFEFFYRSPTPSSTSDRNNENLNRLLTCISQKK